MDAEELAAVARAVDEGARAVHAVWGNSWADGDGQLVTVVVGDAHTLRAALHTRCEDRGCSKRHPVRVGAVTVPTWGSGGPTVLVDGGVWTSLSTTGRSVLVTHELVHLATGSVRSAAPRWLDEGLADWVAWDQGDLPVSIVAKEAIQEVQRNGVPGRLPTDGAFAAGARSSPVAYGQAYLAVRLIAETYGQGVLVGLVREVDSGGEVDSALRSLTGHGLADLTSDWQDDLAKRAATQATEP